MISPPAKYLRKEPGLFARLLVRACIFLLSVVIRLQGEKETQQTKALYSRPEKYWRDAIMHWLMRNGCDGINSEVVVTNGRADIVTPFVAYEVDFACKWHEALGQALHYAAELKLQPGIFILVSSLAEAQSTPCQELCKTIRHFGLNVQVTLIICTVDGAVIPIQASTLF